MTLSDAVDVPERAADVKVTRSLEHCESSVGLSDRRRRPDGPPNVAKTALASHPSSWKRNRHTLAVHARIIAEAVRCFLAGSGHGCWCLPTTLF